MIMLAFRRGVVEVSFLKSISERPHKLFLIWLDDPDGSFVEVGEIVAQQLHEP